MNILPKFEDVRKTAQTVEYKVLPVLRDSFGYLYTHRSDEDLKECIYSLLHAGVSSGG